MFLLAFILCKIILAASRINGGFWLKTNKHASCTPVAISTEHEFCCTHVHLYLFRHFYQDFQISVSISVFFFSSVVLVAFSFLFSKPAICCALHICDSVEYYVPLCVIPKSKNHVFREYKNFCINKRDWITTLWCSTMMKLFAWIVECLNFFSYVPISHFYRHSKKNIVLVFVRSEMFVSEIVFQYASTLMKSVPMFVQCHAMCLSYGIFVWHENPLYRKMQSDKQSSPFPLLLPPSYSYFFPLTSTYEYFSWANIANAPANGIRFVFFCLFCMSAAEAIKKHSK